MKLYIFYKLKMQIFKGETTKVCWQLFSRYLCVCGATHVRTVMDLLSSTGMSSPTNHISGYFSLRLVISWILSAYTEYCRYDFCAPWTQKKSFERVGSGLRVEAIDVFDSGTKLRSPTPWPTGHGKSLITFRMYAVTQTGAQWSRITFSNSLITVPLQTFV